jgi:hypothetical protein
MTVKVVLARDGQHGAQPFDLRRRRPIDDREPELFLRAIPVYGSAAKRGKVDLIALTTPASVRATTTACPARHCEGTGALPAC